MTPPSAPANFLVSSAGRRGALVNLLKEVVELNGAGGGVFTADRSPLTSAGWLSDGLDLVPSIAEQGYVDALLEVCTRRNITHLIPTIDTELPVLAKRQDAFRQVGTTVWVSSAETVHIARDKRLTNRWLAENGFPVVRQVDLARLDDLGGADYPALAKPAAGSSSSGLHHLRTAEDAARLDESQDYVVEAMARGDEFTVDVLVDRAGRCRQAVPRQRLETRAGEVSKAMTVRDDALMALASDIANRLPGAFGILNIQIFKEASTSEMKVIEINARFGGGFPLTWAAGSLMPWWLVQDIAGGRPSAPLDWLPQQLMLRYDAAVHLDCRT